MQQLPAPETRLETQILSLTKLDGRGATFQYFDPSYLRGFSVDLDRTDFGRLGSPGFLRVAIEVVDPATAFRARAEELGR